MRFAGPRRMLAVTAVTVLALTGCSGGEDGDTDGAPEETTPPTATAPAETGEGEDQRLTITAVDYDYRGIGDTVAAGTTVRLQNDSEAEAHEIVALRVDDGETRPFEELLALPQEEAEQITTFHGVALAPPGGHSTALPTPPLVLTEPGRYVFACFIPTGAPPDEVMAAVREFATSGATEGAPDYPKTGPPHIAQGMAAEVIVE